jgi:uncharacterized membrane protein
MEPVTISSPSTTATTTPLSPGGFDLLSLLLNKIGDSAPGAFSFDSILSFLNTLWVIYALLAYLFCIFLLVLYVYASTGKKQLEDLDTEARKRREQIYQEHFKGLPKNNRVQDMLDHIGSDSPSDWKLAIIEADIILDEILKDAGYAGTSLGERLRSISPQQLRSLDDAWQAHKVRNQIAHGGADFILTKRLAEDTIKQYRRVFHEMGIQ